MLITVYGPQSANYSLTISVCTKCPVTSLYIFGLVSSFTTTLAMVSLKNTAGISKSFV